ncbi:hypothetical protein OIO90_002981 [Microbotryomycetes sp. JL221]|nr:hypothetical protein OIO90_002981 [Microbotryomycetes sp. JL221]
MLDIWAKAHTFSSATLSKISSNLDSATTDSPSEATATATANTSKGKQAEPTMSSEEIASLSTSLASGLPASIIALISSNSNTAASPQSAAAAITAAPSTAAKTESTIDDEVARAVAAARSGSRDWSSTSTKHQVPQPSGPTINSNAPFDSSQLALLQQIASSNPTSLTKDRTESFSDQPRSQPSHPNSPSVNRYPPRRDSNMERMSYNDKPQHRNEFGRGPRDGERDSRFGGGGRGGAYDDRNRSRDRIAEDEERPRKRRWDVDNRANDDVSMMHPRRAQQQQQQYAQQQTRYPSQQHQTSVPPPPPRSHSQFNEAQAEESFTRAPIPTRPGADEENHARVPPPTRPTQSTAQQSMPPQASFGQPTQAPLPDGPRKQPFQQPPPQQQQPPRQRMPPEQFNPPVQQIQPPPPPAGPPPSFNSQTFDATSAQSWASFAPILRQMNGGVMPTTEQACQFLMMMTSQAQQQQRMMMMQQQQQQQGGEQGQQKGEVEATASAAMGQQEVGDGQQSMTGMSQTMPDIMNGQMMNPGDFGQEMQNGQGFDPEQTGEHSSSSGQHLGQSFGQGRNQGQGQFAEQ